MKIDPKELYEFSFASTQSGSCPDEAAMHLWDRVWGMHDLTDYLEGNPDPEMFLCYRCSMLSRSSMWMVHHDRKSCSHGEVIGTRTKIIEDWKVIKSAYVNYDGSPADPVDLELSWDDYRRKYPWDSSGLRYWKITMGLKVKGLTPKKVRAARKAFHKDGSNQNEERIRVYLKPFGGAQ